LPSNSIGHGEKPTLVVGSAIRWLGVSHMIFVVLADSTYVGQFRELKFQHAIPQNGLAASILAGGRETRCSKA
jgi:hypothetical protein